MVVIFGGMSVSQSDFKEYLDYSFFEIDLCLFLFVVCYYFKLYVLILLRIDFVFHKKCDVIILLVNAFFFVIFCCSFDHCILLKTY